MAFEKKGADVDSGVKVNKSTAANKDEAHRPTRNRISSDVDSKKESASDKDSAGPAKRERVPGQRSGEKKSDTPKKNNLIPIVIGALLIIIVVVVYVATTDSPQEESNSDPTDAQIQTPQETQSEEDRLKQELEDAGFGVGSKSNSSQINVSSDTMLKDIDGNSLPELWEVQTITYINDIVFCTKRRAVTGTGVELYWLEGEYKGQNCRIIVPYTYFKDFPEAGGLVCRIEVVETTTGQKVFTWFSYDHAAHTKLLNQ